MRTTLTRASPTGFEGSILTSQRTIGAILHSSSGNEVSKMYGSLAWTKTGNYNATIQTVVMVTYTKLLESLPLAVGELLCQRVLRFLRPRFRSPRLLVLGFLVSDEQVSENGQRNSTSGGTFAGAGVSVAGVDIVARSAVGLETRDPILRP